MVNYYEIVKDMEALEEFVEWLPDLKSDEVFYLSLFARNKYTDTDIRKGGTVQLTRQIVTKENLINRILRLEIQEGLYTDKRQGVIPQEALALYINVNPRSTYKATCDLGHDILKFLGNTNENKVFSLQKQMLTFIAKAKTRKYIMFDFDLNKETKEQELRVLLRYIDDNINEEAYNTILTNSGLHLYVDPRKVKKVYRDSWYLAFQNNIYHDNIPGADIMSPVPGCVQGNFVPVLNYHVKVFAFD